MNPESKHSLRPKYGSKPEYELPAPPHFDPSKAGQLWRVPYQQRASEARAWAKLHDIRSMVTDRPRICLMPIDVQNSFCLPDFELFVAGRSGRGAIDDNVRLCEFIYRNMAVITEIAPTMDTHTAMQIFHEVFWINDKEEHPPPMTIISVCDVETGKWRINPDVAANLPENLKSGDYSSLRQYALHYVKKLEASGKYPLVIWPYHAMLGGVGHALVSIVEEALFFHNFARHSQTGFEIKGGNPLTEHYSVLSPEVLDDVDGKPIALKNTRFSKKLLDFDAVIIAGQAKSHCVAWTIADLLGEIMFQDPKLVKKVYLLEDCTSAVVVPGVVDFTEQAEDAFKKFAAAGMNVVKSTEPMSDWPGLAR
ncbi:MAG: isochorismatase [Nitrospirae bacterium]|nr:isochorismatase [Nitrospirota bacterium]